MNREQNTTSLVNSSATKKPQRSFVSTIFVISAIVASVFSAAPGYAQVEPIRAQSEFPTVTLESHARSDAAVKALGAHLPSVAKWYGKTPEEFAATLRRDKHARLDRSGRLYYVDEFPSVPTTTASGGTSTINGALLPADQTFKLHSKPGSQRVIYLDFNGHVATGTAWNNAYGAAAIDAPAFDLDGNPSSFSAAELDRIQYFWQRVSEDFSQFDVDVTTEEPPVDAIARSDSNDLQFGTRVVITKDWTVNTANPCACGGFAYVGVFDDTNEYYKPAYVFYDQLGSGDEKYVAEAISHETGHNLGLSHDGTTAGEAYYIGHGTGTTGWAPIMGAGYYKNLVQWSNGDYQYANNYEDDIARIQMFGVPLRLDDHGNTISTATPLTANLVGTSVVVSGDGVIESQSDVDVFSFTTGAGTFSLNVVPAARSPNLDLSVELYDSAGNFYAASNPVDALNASININSAAAGTYYLKVKGTGKTDWPNGYSAYGSLGQYVITGSAQDQIDAPPVAVVSATPTSGTYPLTVAFNGSGSYDPDGGGIFSYVWSFGDNSDYAFEANPSHVYTTSGTFSATLTVGGITGPLSSKTILINVAPPATVGKTMHVGKMGMSLAIKRTGTAAIASITVTDNNGKAVPGAFLWGTWSGVVAGDVGATANSKGVATVTSPLTKSHGTFTFTMHYIGATGYEYDPTKNVVSVGSIAY